MTLSFCCFAPAAGHVVNEPLIASTVSRIPVSNELFRTPVLLLTQGSVMDEFSDLSLTLETLLRQPGIEPKNVIVFYNITCCPSVRHLVNLFGFMSIPYPEEGQLQHQQQSLVRDGVEDDSSSSNDGDGGGDIRDKAAGEAEQIDLLKDSLQTAQLLFPEANQLILMESHLILSPDFLPFFGQMIPLLSNSRQSGISFISAWNENGFLKTSSDETLVYRADARRHGARFAVMINRIASFDYWNRKNRQDRISWSFDGSIPTLPVTGVDPDQSIPYVIFPDMSRVSIIVASLGVIDQQRDSSTKSAHHRQEDAFMRDYLSQARTLNTDEDARIVNTDDVVNASSHESSVRKLISSQQTTYNLNQGLSILTSSSSFSQADHQSNGFT
jgi:hypothetical protein